MQLDAADLESIVKKTTRAVLAELRHRQAKPESPAPQPGREKMGPADEQYGYIFGCDGVVSREKATELLACHKATLYRLCSKGLVRRGRMGGRAKFCRRSIAEYSKSLEH